MSFRYFAYGSNMWLPQMRSRCPSAKVVGITRLQEWRLVCDKPSTDGSAKLNIRPNPEAVTEGVVYEIEDEERPALDEAEPRYTPTAVAADAERTLTYVYEGEASNAAPYDWYLAVATLGAASHGLTGEGLELQTTPDPLAPGIRPATVDDIGLIQSILSQGLATATDRHYIHPGDFAWWIYHDDPRHPDHLTTWIQGDAGFVTLDSQTPQEISVFTRPSIDRMPLIRWSQRRLDGRGEIGWVRDGDLELVDRLASQGYRHHDPDRTFSWDLREDLPVPELSPGWSLRPLAGEEEANARRAASHAAFESTMPSAMHLQRYLSFMRSPVYVPDRDLVAVTPEGTIAAFMVWWADDSGVAQIEPFGTHPDFHRRGIGRALIYHGLSAMKVAGMHTCRVQTRESRPATHFYKGVGFQDTGRVWWWRPP